MENNAKDAPKEILGPYSSKQDVCVLHDSRETQLTPEYRRDHCNYSFYAATQLVVTPSFHTTINLQKELF